MKCPNCEKEVSELDEKCPACGLIFDEYEQKNKESDTGKKSKTLLLRFINAIQLIGCIIIAFVFWKDEEILKGFAFLFSGIILFAFIKGFIDVIDLLDNIYKGLKK